MWNGTQLAQESLVDLRDLSPEDRELKLLIKRLDALKAEIQADKNKAQELYQQAVALDTGSYSQEAIALLTIAKELDQNSEQIVQLIEKMSNYNSEYSVPEDFATIAEAIQAARSGDTIKIGAGTFKECIEVNKRLNLIGSPSGATIIEIPATEAAVITIKSDASNSVVSGLTLRHKGFDTRDERNSGIIVQGKDVVIKATIIEKAAGHGIAVIEGASAEISFCKILESGWDGISVYGEGSKAKVTDTLSEKNFQHGIGFWKGGSGSVMKSFVMENGLCGIVAMSEGLIVDIRKSSCSSNRQAGILASSGVKANIDGNSCKKNLQSGIVSRGISTLVNIINNECHQNMEAGIAIYEGVKISKFGQNKAKGNVKHQMVKGLK